MTSQIRLQLTLYLCGCAEHNPSSAPTAQIAEAAAAGAMTPLSVQDQQSQSASLSEPPPKEGHSQTRGSHTNGEGGLLQAQRDEPRRNTSGGRRQRRGRGGRGRGVQGPQVAGDAQPAGRVIVCLCIHDLETTHQQHPAGVPVCMCCGDVPECSLAVLLSCTHMSGKKQYGCCQELMDCLCFHVGVHVSCLTNMRCSIPGCYVCSDFTSSGCGIGR